MICVEQTKCGGPGVPPNERGDCLSACVASILELPLDQIPHFAALYDATSPAGEDYAWWDELQRFCAECGVDVWWLDADMIRTYTPTGYWVASVLSLNVAEEDGKPARHVIVMQGATIVWDPNVAPAKRYEGPHLSEADLCGGYVFLARDPSKALA